MEKGNFIQLNVANNKINKGQSKRSKKCKNDSEIKEMKSNPKKKKRPKKLNDIIKYNSEEINTISILNF